MGARREVTASVLERHRAAGRAEKGRIHDELTATTDWHRKQVCAADVRAYDCNRGLCVGRRAGSGSRGRDKIGSSP